MRRSLAMLVSMMLMIAACGDSSGGEGPDDTGVETTGAAQQAGEAAPDTTETPGTSSTSTDEQEEDDEPTDASSPTSGLGEATITLDGDTYLFGETSLPSLRCDPDMFGVFWVLLGQVDAQGNEVANGGSLQLLLLIEGTDPDEVGQVPEAMLVLPDLEQAWIADPEEIALSGLDPGSSQVDDYTIKATTSRGRLRSSSVRAGSPTQRVPPTATRLPPARSKRLVAASAQLTRFNSALDVVLRPPRWR